MEILDERIVDWLEAKKQLAKKSKEKELGYEQKNAFEHLSKFCKLPEKKATELITDLDKLGKLKDRHKIAILNFLPTTPEQMRMLFAHEIISLTDDDKKKIATAVKKHM